MTAGLIVIASSLLALCVSVVRNPFVRSGTDMFFVAGVCVGFGFILKGLL